MCVEKDEIRKRLRWQRVLANLALVAGLLLWNFARQTGHPRPWLDAGIGLLMGISMGANLMLAVKARRCRAAS
ncbi:MAG TPA: hypothetical protein VG893_04445 [Terracidiphilus sp.]|nr:hypothetical protein [Terracidiphilus sp.]